MVAANRIASAVLQAYNLRQSLPVALDHLHNGGAIEHTLGVYRKLMTERDKTPKVLTDRTEEQHRDSFDVSLLANPYLHPQVEVKVTKVIHPSSLAYKISNIWCREMAGKDLSILC